MAGVTATMRRTRSLAAGAVVLVLVGAACSATGDHAAAPSTTTSAPTTATRLPVEPHPIRWEHCAADHDCATLTVPLDWSHPHGATTDIAMARIPAKNPARRIGSL